MEEETDEMIEGMIKWINDAITPWLQTGADALVRFIDPLDGEEISAHYGATHAAAAWIIYGQRIKDKDMEAHGIALLESVLDRWNESIRLPAYHFDFNNFALCAVYPYLSSPLAEQVKETVLATQDSNNPTTNWYPMRWYVNECRYQWTGEEKYKNACEVCKKGIRDATYADGFIDDRAPKGKSFNLQYDLASVAALQYMRAHGVEIDISKELGALLNAVSPDGDINYLGRGVNQVFAWGLWIYLLKTAGCGELNRAVGYLNDRLPSMLDNHSMMLNEWPGEEKYLWWDYHYCSVYTAHLFLWLVLALEDDAPIKVQTGAPSDSGLKICEGANYKVVTFSGRSEYLAERGPSVALVWTERAGVVVKGSFAPWQGAFGNRYTMTDVALRNYCGLLEVKTNKDYSQNRYVHKLLPDLHTTEQETVSPIFAPVDVVVHDGVLELKWETDGKTPFMVNIPTIVFCAMNCSVDGKKVKLINTMKLRNQYGWVDLWQSRIVSGKTVTLHIEL